MENVIVTGANGFIGKNLVNELIEQGYYVYALVRDKSEYSLSLNANLKVIECSMENYTKLSEIIKEPVDIIFHLAWNGVSGANRANYEVQLNNVKYSCDLLKSCIDMGVKRFVNFGSIMEFEFENTFEKKNYSISQNYTYSIAKVMTRDMLLMIANNNVIDFVPLFLSNVYGPNDMSNRFITNLLRKMINKEEIDLSSCEQMYDFIYITDAVKAIIEVAKKGRKNVFYYIGNKEIKSLKEYVIKIKELIDNSARLNFGKVKNNCEINYAKINTTLLQDEINYIPSMKFDEGIKKTYEWLKTVN